MLPWRIFTIGLRRIEDIKHQSTIIRPRTQCLNEQSPPWQALYVRLHFFRKVSGQSHDFLLGLLSATSKGNKSQALSKIGWARLRCAAIFPALDRKLPIYCDDSLDQCGQNLPIYWEIFFGSRSCLRKGFTRRQEGSEDDPRGAGAECWRRKKFHQPHRARRQSAYHPHHIQTRTCVRHMSFKTRCINGRGSGARVIAASPKLGRKHNKDSDEPAKTQTAPAVI